MEDVYIMRCLRIHWLSWLDYMELFKQNRLYECDFRLEKYADIIRMTIYFELGSDVSAHLFEE